MAITKSVNNPAQGSLVATGRFLDSAASPAAAVLDLGFKPRYFKWINLTDRVFVEKFDGMANTDSMKTDASGTQTLDTSSLVLFGTPTGSQDGSQGTADQTNAGVVNNVTYPGPATVVNSTATEIPGTEADNTVTIDASLVLQNKQYSWIAIA